MLAANAIFAALSRHCFGVYRGGASSRSGRPGVATRGTCAAATDYCWVWLAAALQADNGAEQRCGTRQPSMVCCPAATVVPGCVSSSTLLRSFVAGGLPPIYRTIDSSTALSWGTSLPCGPMQRSPFWGAERWCPTITITSAAPPLVGWRRYGGNTAFLHLLRVRCKRYL